MGRSRRPGFGQEPTLGEPPERRYQQHLIAVLHSAVESVAVASRAWDEAYASGDATRLAERYDAQAVSMPPGLTALASRSVIEADFKAFFESNTGTHRTFDADRQIAGDFVIERARYEATIRPKDGSAAVHEAGKHVVVYRRQADSSWKVFWEIWNSDD
jgi:ketosteroid isomerase-like protein